MLPGGIMTWLVFREDAEVQAEGLAGGWSWSFSLASQGQHLEWPSLSLDDTVAFPTAFRLIL